MAYSSWAIGITSTVPVTGSTGQVFLPTTAGTTYLVPHIYLGASGSVPWRSSTSLTMLAPTGTAYSYTTTGSYAPFIANAGMNMDMSRFRQARLLVFGSVQAGSYNGTVKVVDTTNSQDITSTVALFSTTAARKISTWGDLNAATYGSTGCEFELQALEGTTGSDVLKIYSAQLELR